MTSIFQDSYRKYEKEISWFIHNFSTSGEALGNQDRNSLELFKLEGQTINVKSFKVTNIVNQIA